MSDTAETATDSLDNLFGTPNYENSSKHRVLKLKQPDKKKGETETTVVVKILPPMHNARNRKGINWAFRAANHWGYQVIDDKDPTKTFGRTFRCVEKSYNKVIELHCPECDLIRPQKERMREIEAELEKKFGKGSPEIDKALEADAEYAKLDGFCSTHNLDVKMCLNAKTLAGDYVELQLSSTTWGKLKTFAETWKRDPKQGNGQDIMDPNGGCWVSFKTTGNMRTKSDDPSVYMEEVDVPGHGKFFKPKSGALTPEEQRRAVESCRDISEPNATILTVEQIQELVDSGNDPEVVTAIFNAAKQAA